MKHKKIYNTLEYLLRDDCNFIIVYWVDIQEQNINNHVVETTLIAGYHSG